jgi:hypothetical protein
LPSGDHNGWCPSSSFETWYFVPVGGNGWTYNVFWPPLALLVAYATHRPSGENTALVGHSDCTASNGATFLSGSESTHSETVEPFVTLNKSRSPAGDHDSGM